MQPPQLSRLNYLRGDHQQRDQLLRRRPVSRARCHPRRHRRFESHLGGSAYSPYAITWKDRLNPAAMMPENTGTQTYLQFTTAEQTRLNVVYVGANDGFCTGFEPAVSM